MTTNQMTPTTTARRQRVWDVLQRMAARSERPSKRDLERTLSAVADVPVWVELHWEHGTTEPAYLGASVAISGDPCKPMRVPSGVDLYLFWPDTDVPRTNRSATNARRGVYIP